MESIMFKKTKVAAVSAIALCVASTAKAETTITNIPDTKLDWSISKEGVGFAPLIGDRFKESYMAMVKLPAGLVSPVHVKTSNMFGVVIAGTVSHIAEGADTSTELLLPIGSFYKIPKNLAHVSKCVSTTDCITFLYQDGKFDFLPTGK